MKDATTRKRFAEEVVIGLGLGVVRVEFSKEDFCLFGLDGLIFTRLNFCVFALDGLIFTKRWLSAAVKHISEKSQNHCYWALQISAKGCNYIKT